MHTNTHGKLLTVLTIDSHTAPAIVVHTLDDRHGLFVYTQVSQGPPQDLSWRMIEDSLKVNEGKIELFVSSGDVLLLQLANNEDGTSVASTRHKGKLHLVNVHHLADGGILYPFQQLHDLICEFETIVVTVVKGFTIALIKIQDETLLPAYWGHTIAENSLCQFSY